MNEELIVKYIKTKNKVRKIVTYRDDGELRKYHEKVVAYLDKHVAVSKFAKAYAPKTSIYKNAYAHMYNDIFLKMDIKDFFPSINHHYLAECLYYEINKNTSISRRECYEIVKKCSVGKKGLPLGLVTSPALANLYMKEFDGLLYGKLKKMDIKRPIYTRYADDMVISFQSQNDYLEKVELIKKEIDVLLKRTHLSINHKKTELFNLEKTNHVRITGVSITKDKNNYRHLSVGRKLKNHIFWSAINQYDKKEKNYKEIEHLKGLYSFVLSIEKRGVENCYSDKMKSLLVERGCETLKQLLSSFGEEYKQDETGNEVLN